MDFSNYLTPNNNQIGTKVNPVDLEDRIKNIQDEIDKRMENVADYFKDKPFGFDHVLKENEEYAYKRNEGLLGILLGYSTSLTETLTDNLDSIKSIRKNYIKPFIDVDVSYYGQLIDFAFDVDALDYDKVAFSDAYVVGELVRPSDMSEEDYKDYVEKVDAQKKELKEYGWDDEAIAAYSSQSASILLTYNGNYTKLSNKLTGMNKETLEVGSDIFNTMFDASSKSDLEKVNFVIDIMGGTMEDGYLLLKPTTSTGKPAMKFDPDAYPDSAFFGDFADTVESAYILDGRFKDVDDNFIKVHQFRYYINKHNIEYIRTNYRKNGMTDLDALKSYNKEHGVNEYKSGAIFGLISALYHQRGQEVDSDYSLNRKWMNDSKYTEFIIDINGNFVTMWDTMHTKSDGTLYIKINGQNFDLVGVNSISEIGEYDMFKGYICSDARDKHTTPEQFEKSLSGIANTSSFNYSGDYTYKVDYESHDELDVVKGYDFPIRDELIQNGPFKSPATPELTFGMYDGRSEYEEILL